MGWGNYWGSFKDWALDQVWPVAYKEFVHMMNDPSTLRIAILLPILQLALFGYAINLDVSNIKTVILDQDRQPEAHRLQERLVNTSYFRIMGQAYSKQAVMDALRQGKAQVGIVIPPNYSKSVAMGKPAKFQVLIDGSQSATATQVLAAATQLGGVIAQEATINDQPGLKSLVQPRVEAEPYVMYNPSLNTAFFTVPGLLGLVLLNVTLFLTTFSLVKERETGTMDQLFVTPLEPSGLLVGKMAPYVVLSMFDFNLVVLAMIVIFKVPIKGSLWMVEFCALLFLVSVLGLGLLISSRSKTQVSAAQTAGLVVMPSILLSGFVFSIDAMPPLMQAVSYIIPTTYFITCIRAIVLRGAGFMDLLQPMGMLIFIGGVIMMASIQSFKRRLS